MFTRRATITTAAILALAGSVAIGLSGGSETTTTVAQPRTGDSSTSGPALPVQGPWDQCWGPNGWDPNCWGPGPWDPGQYGPGMMGPGGYGPGMMAPGQWGPGPWGPGMMGPGQWGPGQWGPGMMGPGPWDY